MKIPDQLFNSRIEFPIVVLSFVIKNKNCGKPQADVQSIQIPVVVVYIGQAFGLCENSLPTFKVAKPVVVISFDQK